MVDPAWFEPDNTSRLLDSRHSRCVNVNDRRAADQPSYPFNFTRPWHMRVWCTLGEDAFRISWKFHRLVHDVQGGGGYTRWNLESTVRQKGRRVLLGQEPSRNVDTQMSRGHVVYRGGAGVYTLRTCLQNVKCFQHNMS
ncbi:unnamed protein product, partial [Ectocarpus fasciculatus]